MVILFSATASTGASRLSTDLFQISSPDPTTAAVAAPDFTRATAAGRSAAGRMVTVIPAMAASAVISGRRPEITPATATV